MVHEFIGRTLKDGESIRIVLTATEVTTIGRAVLTRRMKMEPLSKLGIKSKKTNMGVAFVWVALVGAVIASKLYVDPAVIVGYLKCASWVVIAHIIGHSITDGMIHFGVGKSSE